MLFLNLFRKLIKCWKLPYKMMKIKHGDISFLFHKWIAHVFPMSLISCKCKVNITLLHRLRNTFVFRRLIKTFVPKSPHKTKSWGCGYLTVASLSSRAGNLHRMEMVADAIVIKISWLSRHRLVHVCSNWRTLLYTTVHGFIGINCLFWQLL